MATIPYTITNESVTVILDGITYTVKEGDPNFELAKDAVLSERWEDLPLLLTKGFALEKWAEDMEEGFTFKDNHMFYRGEQVPSELNTRMLAMAKAGEDPRFLARFYERLQENPSYRSVNELYSFLLERGIAITEDGMILAYKGIREDWTDRHSGKINNRVGQKPWMPRNKVSDEYNSACHDGFHAGTLSYALNYAGSDGRVVVVQLDPKDVVTVCRTAQKVRINTYEVVGVHGTQLPDTSYDTRKDEALASAAASVADKLAEQRGTLPATSAEAWRSFGDLSDEEIPSQKVHDLRKYASKVLRIVGASKLRKEGPSGLVARILDVRRQG